MNYNLHYNLLIEKSKNRDKPDVFERHHIVPKSMGGDNSKENIALLTPREHYMAHYLLWKIHKNISMQRAFWCMLAVRSKGRNYKVNSRLYESMRILQSEDMRKAKIGIKESIETREKKSRSHTGVKRGLSPLKGISMPIDDKWIISCPHCKMQGTVWNMKRYHFDNCLISNPTRVIYSKSKGKVLTKHKCPHREIETSMGNLKRWHFDKCKNKENNHVH